MIRVASLLAIFLSSAVIAGQPNWITIRNENFRVYSSAGERATRDALNQFERVRGFFVQLGGAAPDSPAPITVVIFGSEGEYQPYRIKAFASAYYASVSERDFIVIGTVSPQSSQTATHEYTHLILEHAGFTLPPWLSEGMAELYSTLHSAGDDTEFGDVLPGRLQELNREPWVPLETILAADRKSPYYNESSQAGSLYNESWALVHMLATTEKYRPQFWPMVHAVNNGTPSVQALETAYGEPLAKIEIALRFYVEEDSFNKLVVKIRLEGTENLASRPADMFEVREALALLLTGMPGKDLEARSRLEQLAREDPKRPEPWVDLGYLAWGDGKPGEAAQHFGKAFELGGRSPRLLLAYAELGGQEKPESLMAALTALIDQQPRNVVVRLALADLQLGQGQFSTALATAATITTVRTAEQRDDLLYLRAFAYLRSGEPDKARKLAEELQTVTASQDCRSQAEEILRLAHPQ
jgi:Flp pilus assembly protein TadD